MLLATAKKERGDSAIGMLMLLSYLQMAVASVHHIDYLLTWNYAHLANPSAQLRLDNLCSEAGHRAPIMVSPESVPRSRRGQSIRRD